MGRPLPRRVGTRAIELFMDLIEARRRIEAARHNHMMDADLGLD